MKICVKICVDTSRRNDWRLRVHLSSTNSAHLGVRVCVYGFEFEVCVFKMGDGIEWLQVSGSGDAMDQGSDWSIGLRERRAEQQRSNNTMNERTRRLVPWFVVVVTGSMSLG